MLEAGIISESDSPYAIPLVVVKKKDGTLRLCVDYRTLNEVTEFDAYPMPNIEEIIDRLGGAKYLTTIDLTKGYCKYPWQTKLSENLHSLLHLGYTSNAIWDARRACDLYDPRLCEALQKRRNKEVKNRSSCIKILLWGVQDWSGTGKSEREQRCSFNGRLPCRRKNHSKWDSSRVPLEASTGICKQ